MKVLGHPNEGTEHDIKREAFVQGAQSLCERMKTGSSSHLPVRGGFKQLADFVPRNMPMGMAWNDTPKMSGPHRRCGRPYCELSPFHSALALALVLVVFGLFLTLLGVMSR